MRIKKGKIEELITTDGELIGFKDKPEISNNADTQANKTTDYNAKVSGQNFKNDFLGRFGFYFYESEDGGEKLMSDLAMIMYEKFLESLEYYYENPDKLKVDYEKHFDGNNNKSEMIDDTDKKWASKIMDVIEPHLKKSLNENKVDEDKLTKKKDNDIVDKKKETEIIDKKMKKVAELLDKLSDKEIDKLINVLESKRNK